MINFIYVLFRFFLFDYNFYLNIGIIKVLKGGIGVRFINRLNGENDSIEIKKFFIICGLFV